MQNSIPKKDIVLVLGDGGMMGIFVAGVAAVINKKLRPRIHSVYGTSSGADVGAYLVSNQTDIPLRFFTEHLTKTDFIRKNFLRYLLKIFFFKDSQSVRIKDYINVEYVAEIAQYSDCKLDMQVFEKSDIDFYVKVIDTVFETPTYIPAKTNVFKKLMATSQCGPLSTKAIEVDGRKYIDGGTLPSDLDIRLVQRHPDKLFIIVQSQKENYLERALLYPLYLLAGHAISVLYGRNIGRKYSRTLFADYSRELRAQKNVIFIKNDLYYSSFCTDKKRLEQVYCRGIAMGEAMLASLGYT